ncbi:MAG: plasmid stability protein [Pseudomonadota bacterium]
MPTLTVRHIPALLYERLRERAQRHRRSLSGETVTLLEAALLPQPTDPDALIAEARAFHARFPEPLPDLIAAGKHASRRYDDTEDDRLREDDRP